MVDKYYNTAKIWIIEPFFNKIVYKHIYNSIFSRIIKGLKINLFDFTQDLRFLSTSFPQIMDNFI